MASWLKSAEVVDRRAKLVVSELADEEAESKTPASTGQGTQGKKVKSRPKAHKLQVTNASPISSDVTQDKSGARTELLDEKPGKDKDTHKNEVHGTDTKPSAANSEQTPGAGGNGKANHNRKRKRLFPYGNYDSYYNYRVDQKLEEDPRLKVMRQEWFEGKYCLDIGCNSGKFTVQIAKKFHCRHIHGVDIDGGLVREAQRNLRTTLRMESAAKPTSEASNLKVDKNSYGSKHDFTDSSNEGTKDITNALCSTSRDLARIISFQQKNFVEEAVERQYDTVLCLSVTKWIHLNWGDDGLITTFVKIWKLLRPDGVLVLEPQPWKSYESNYQVSETTAANYRSIKIRPDEFQDILLDKIGFRTVEDVTSSLSGSKIGFNRPILVFRK